MNDRRARALLARAATPLSPDDGNAHSVAARVRETRSGVSSLVALALAASITACSAPAPEPSGGAWQRVDLAAHPFRVEVASGVPDEIRIGQTPRGRNHPISGRSWGPPEVVTLRQAVGSRVSWRLTLGREPYLGLAPLGSQRAGCRGELRASVRDDSGKTSELVREPLRLSDRFAAADREIDLGSWTGETVEIVLEVSAAAGDHQAPTTRRPCRGVWASPAVYSRDDPTTVAARTARPNVVLIGLDTFRADHWTSRPAGVLSSTPALDRLAAESDVWLNAYSTFNNTNPSFISIHTGLYGRSHGIYDLVTPLPDPLPTLAERFRDAGYSTAAVVSANHVLHASGLGRGFESFEGPERSTAAASFVVDRAIDWISREREPFFAWLHFFDTHTPTLPPEPYASGLRPAAPSGLSPVERWSPFRELGSRSFSEPENGGHPDLYAGEAAYLDRQIDRLLGFLDSRGLLANTFVVVVADHGESLGEHDLLHDHFGLYEPSVHVPLVVRWPDATTPRGRAAGAPRGRRFRALVQTVDLLPSLLAATGLANPATAADGTEGLDLWEVSLDAAGGSRGRDAVFAEHANREGAMIRTARYKYIWMEPNDQVDAGAYLFDLATDPAEDVNLAGRGLEIELELSRALAAWRGAGKAPLVESRVPRGEDLESLRALGYVQ
jgi:arylsulfatase A-like enzyme